MNRVVLVGRITKDPELRYTSSQVPVVQFTIAVNRRFSNANGERQADFINCVVWRQAAENLSKYIKKGGLLGVEGQLQTRTYDDPSGQRKYITEVVCDAVNFLEPKGASNNSGSGYNNVDNYSIPQAPQATQVRPNVTTKKEDPFEDLQNDYNFSDDDLPF